MRITLFGSTGGTGRHLLQQAATAGHSVTAVVRRRPAEPVIPASRVVEADVMDPDAIADAVAGAEAVISALGLRRGSTEPVVAPGVESIIEAMQRTGTGRLVVITASGHVRDPHDDFFTAALFKPVLRRVLRAPFVDFAHADRLVSTSDLDWTIMRPPRLTDGGRRPYRTAVDHTVRRGLSISRADLAAATLAAAGDPRTIGHAIAVGY